MKVATDISSLQNILQALKSSNSDATIGFVPTMGALHQGHLRLVEKAKESADFVVVSIFVNPTQFNDPKDLEKYPRTVEADSQKLEKAGVDLLFLPTEEVMYPNGKPTDYQIDLGRLNEVMEGKFRKNHFEGVAMVVERFFRIVEPNKAFFGLKDFQQLAVIKRLVKLRQFNIDIVPVEIERESSGLAMSSRNMLLSEEEKKQALDIINCLNFGSARVGQEVNPQSLKEIMIKEFEKGHLKLEYLEIVDSNSLENATSFEGSTQCCVAAYCGSVRLIDNMKFS
ncbi:pantoate--beta-alanine ligase [Paracrocinitomix mangrovi]|uniref:pantoate--beta-alanine ligase n=1 Tax=Paracrocinitomix mangrovi TaxID=2862509 RepID=UPI001C8D57DD|nr:pantoate--beta-alanine ligase [Paracrocinitomix mangrovi]UKN00635.1 pantoate--beta-alanine ligase [Paracrocinitomix mangrovi]